MATTGATYDAIDLRSQQEQREEIEARAATRARLELDDLKWVMSNKRGRRFVHGMLERAGVWRLSFHTNALQMAFNEGTRNEGLALLGRLIEHCSDTYAQMLKEQRDDE